MSSTDCQLLKKTAALGNESTTRLSRNYRANPFAEASESFPVAAPMVFLEFLPLWRAHVPGNTCHGHILVLNAHCAKSSNIFNQCFQELSG